ncbi:hypothetical protein Plano_2537 [Planococcus sp. PAMC 21323]|uniref:DUF2382 domain-containing protein n=1 Tax=Planococcus sp. PAMC 21323 TaxID=1526927 RepID=UPI000571C62D|nr:DUF2382 domain-containing protein [Planococcus sp. PAMC 21323]AIY06502.1 hypothetical protein Plano_2537 [Planococcus sp. PAMC 21323]
MTNNKFMGTFDSETEVLNKIEELKAQGSSENDMYVMARDEDQISMVRGRTDVDYKSSEGNWMDKFMGFLSGDDSTREAFSGMGVDKDEADRYYNEVQNGKILLFVDREYGANYEGKAPYDNTSTSAEAGTMGAAGLTGTGLGRNHMDTDAVGRDGLTVDTNDENEVYYNKKNDTFGRDTTETAGVGNESGTGFGLESNRTEEHSTDTSRFENNDKNLPTEEEKMQLHEERLSVDKERVQTGEVNVGKHVVEENQTIEVPVEREEVYIERRPVNEETVGNSFDKESTLTGDAYQEGQDIHIPVSEEHVEVTKKDVISEEIVVGKRKVQDTETFNETVRHEEADIDDDSNGMNNKLGREDRTDRDRF